MEISFEADIPTPMILTKVIECSCSLHSSCKYKRFASYAPVLYNCHNI